MNINAVLLAGGQNKRMNGIPKWELLFGQETMLERSIRKLKEISSQIIVVTGGDYLISPGKGEQTEIKVIYDQKSYLGPLGGIYTALGENKDGFSFIVAADMPFFSTNLANYMIKLALDQQVNIVIPKWQDKLQPLHGVYSPKVLPSIEEDLKQGKYSLIKWLLKQEKVYILEDDEVKKFNTNDRIFFNMNYPNEYQLALKWTNEVDRSE